MFCTDHMSSELKSTWSRALASETTSSSASLPNLHSQRDRNSQLVCGWRNKLLQLTSQLSRTTIVWDPLSMDSLVLFQDVETLRPIRLLTIPLHHAILDLSSTLMDNNVKLSPMLKPLLAILDRFVDLLASAASSSTIS